MLYSPQFCIATIIINECINLLFKMVEEQKMFKIQKYKKSMELDSFLTR